MDQKVSFDKTLQGLDDLLKKWGRHNRFSMPREQSNTADICDYIEMYAVGKKQKVEEDEDIRRGLELGLPTPAPKIDLNRAFDQIDRVFGRLDLWVCHSRERQILKTYYIDLSRCNNMNVIARRLSIKGDVIRERQVIKRLRLALIYFWRIRNA